MPFGFFNGRIEGPVSTAKLFRLEGPLGSQDFGRSESGQTRQVEVQVVPPTREAAEAESASTSGVPAATRSV